MSEHEPEVVHSPEVLCIQHKDHHRHLQLFTCNNIRYMHILHYLSLELHRKPLNGFTH